MEEEYKKALERVENLEKELARIKQAIIALAEGKTISEYMDFDKSVFLEENTMRRESYSALAHMIASLMAIKYCTYYIVSEELENDFDMYREEVKINTGWDMRIEDTHLTAYLLNELQDIYEYGISWYKRSDQEQLDLQDGLRYIPKECPWTLEELMENEIYELTGKLPKRERKM